MKNQKEFEGLPEKTALVKIAEDYLNMVDELDAIIKERDDLKDKLIDEFIKSKETRLNIEGRILSYKHLETDNIVIKNKKE